MKKCCRKITSLGLFKLTDLKTFFEQHLVGDNDVTQIWPELTSQLYQAKMTDFTYTCIPHDREVGTSLVAWRHLWM